MPALNYAVPRDEDGQRLCACAECRHERGDGSGTWYTCADCGEPYDYYEEGGYDYCGACQDRAEYDDENDSPGEYVRNYSYTPSLNFLEGDRDPDADKFYLGWELEVPSEYGSGDIAARIYNTVGNGEQTLYCKEDSSIQGVEIVSHPMTHQWFREKFDFGMFKDSEIKDHLNLQRDGGTGDGYGLHVHVSRTAFKNAHHTLRWLLFVYQNQQHVETVARRSGGQWTSFRDIDQCEEKAANGRYSGERYVAVNAQNEATFEVRVFRSTWNEREFRAAVDFVHASVEYTKTVRALDALKGGLSWEKFTAWLWSKARITNRYASLVLFLADANGEDEPIIPSLPAPVEIKPGVMYHATGETEDGEIVSREDRYYFLLNPNNGYLVSGYGADTVAGELEFYVGRSETYGNPQRQIEQTFGLLEVAEAETTEYRREIRRAYRQIGHPLEEDRSARANTIRREAEERAAEEARAQAEYEAMIQRREQEREEEERAALQRLLAQTVPTVVRADSVTIAAEGLAEWERELLEVPAMTLTTEPITMPRPGGTTWTWVGSTDDRPF